MKNLSSWFSKTTILIVSIASIVGTLVGASVSYKLFTTLNRPKSPTDNDRIYEFYATENAVYVSPHSLRKKMDAQDTSFVLVDLRSEQEYEKAHIVTAVSIPAYKDAETSAYDEVDRIVSAFKALPQDKEIVVYCYSMPCMTGRKVGKMLSEKGIFVKHLGIGWNEWRYFWNLWNHDGEKPSQYQDYIVSGKEPGMVKTSDQLPSPCTEGQFGC